MVWNCVVSAILFTAWKAYKYNNEKYLPAPVEEVDEDLSVFFIDNYIAVNAQNKDIPNELLEFLLANYKRK